uniref:Uncharacterized protein n=1 Tax=Arundo donax TaxID=35708 RepID=A0A0A9B2R4_ARUDO
MVGPNYAMYFENTRGLNSVLLYCKTYR